MKKVLKKLLAYILIACELFQVTGVYALTKDESIYGTGMSDAGNQREKATQYKRYCCMVGFGRCKYAVVSIVCMLFSAL